MSEVKTPIRSLNGHALVDEQARADISTLSEEIVKQTTPIILDTDYGGDCDDAQAVRVLCYYDSIGTVGTVCVSAATNNPLNASAIHAALEYDGALDIPVSLSGAPSNATPYYYNVLAGYPHEVHTPVDTFGAKTYRKVLSAIARKAVLVFVGPLNTLSALLDSEVDEYSDLGGVELVRETVDKVYIMGGGFPDSVVALGGKGAEINGVMTPGAEWNFASAIGAVDNAINKCPVPIVFCGWEIGNAIKCGGGISGELPEKDIMLEAMRIWGGEGTVTNGRDGYDTVAVAIACVGDARKLGFDLVRGEIHFNPNNSTNTFTESETGNHYYVKMRYDADYYQRFINNILSKKMWGSYSTSDRWRHYLEPDVACTGLAVSRSELSFSATDTVQLTATASPDNCSEPIVWISSDANIASVSASGVVTPKANGEAVIYAHCGKKSAACTVVVSAFAEEPEEPDTPEEPDNNGLVYSLKDATFTGTKTEAINTEYPLWQKDRDFTVVADVTPGTQLSDGGCIWWSMDYTNDYKYGGISLDYWSIQNLGEWYVEINQGDAPVVRCKTGISNAETRRTVFVVSHAAGSGVYTITAKTEGEAAVESVAEASFFDAGKNGNLYIGASDHGTGRFFVGNVHEISVFDRVITNEEATEYLNAVN